MLALRNFLALFPKLFWKHYLEGCPDNVHLKTNCVNHFVWLISAYTKVKPYFLHQWFSILDKSYCGSNHPS
jgi:hypothetical protein